MRKSLLLLALPSLPLVAACATVPVAGDPAVAVFATAETEPVGTANEDAADDPAIWRNAESPADSLIVATDKKGGLYVYDLAGKVKHYAARPGLNNVDLVDMGNQIVVFASDRSDLANARIALFRLDPARGRLDDIATLASGPGEAYGICGRRDGERLRVYTALKSGMIGEWLIRFSAASPQIQQLRTMQVPSQPEGCAVDDRNGTLYIGEEAGGIWRFFDGTEQGELVAEVDNRHLVADLEGLALVPDGRDGGWLYASSQGDNTYMRYALPSMTPAGRFRIAAGQFGATEETDGIEAKRGNFGPAFPGGIFIAQDGINEARAQNFKMVPLDEIEKALEASLGSETVADR